MTKKINEHYTDAKVGVDPFVKAGRTFLFKDKDKAEAKAKG